MRDVSNKLTTLRTAVAAGEIRVSKDTARILREGKVSSLPKGDPIPVARVAAIQAAKNTTQIIPYCHNIPIDFVGVEFDVSDDTILITATVKAVAKTGVEMEALSAVSAAALTLYDMLKARDEEMEIVSIRLVSKEGGKSSFAKTGEKERYSAAVLVISDSVAARKSEDISGKLIADKLDAEGFEITAHEVVPDDSKRIAETLQGWTDSKKVRLILCTGGTGLGPRDVTREAVQPLLDKPMPGIEEALRLYGIERTPMAMLGRPVAGARGRSLIVCLPGSPSAVADAFPVLFPYLSHALKVMDGASHRAEKSEEASLDRL
jgi:cyclic pyranopterin phosphate synthase